MHIENIAGDAKKRKNISRLRRKFFHLGGVPSQWRALRLRSVIGWNDQGDVIERLGIAVRAQSSGRISCVTQADIANQLSLGRTVLVVAADEEARSRAAWTVTALAIAWAPTARTMVAS